MLLKLFPFLQWWPELRHTGVVRADMMAGITGAIVVLPQGVAFATIAGMPPEYGLYAAMVPAIIAALFGSSHHLVSGPTTAASIVLFSALSAVAEPGSADFVRYALTLTFMVGVLQLIMGLARLGVLVNFISHSVIVGFTAGAAILIIANQFQHFFGLDMPRGLHFHETLFAVVYNLEQVLWAPTLVGVTTLAAGILGKRWMPKVPYMITALVVGSLLAYVLTLIGGIDLAVVGSVPAALPPLSAPDLSFDTMKQLAPAVLAVSLFALTEAVSISRSLATRSGQLINGNQEFIGQGLSNIVGAFFSAYVATGSFNRSGVNYQAGARTPLAAIVAGVLLMAIVLLVAPLFEYLPNAGMAAVLFMVAWGIIDFHHIRKIVKTSRSESVVLVATFLATLLLELEFAIMLGVLLSLIVYLSQASRPQVLVRAPDPALPKHRFNTGRHLLECPQFKMVRVDGSLFFGAVNFVAERLRIIANRHPQQKHLLILARSIGFIDVAGAELLAREARGRKDMGGALYLHAVKPQVLQTLSEGGYLDEIGEENLFETKSESIVQVFNRLDRKICARCDRRIFLECEDLPRQKAPYRRVTSDDKSGDG
ncbi:MAG: SulP family inorganic anion transporter [Chromatiales bacterium]|nr:SulP family inorganic anion transporter [Chromatiales bacterium]